MAFVRYECRRIIFARAFLRRCFDNTVLLKQSAFRNRGLFLGRYCDVSSYKKYYAQLLFLLLQFLWMNTKRFIYIYWILYCIIKTMSVWSAYRNNGLSKVCLCIKCFYKTRKKIIQLNGIHYILFDFGFRWLQYFEHFEV